MTDDAPVRIVRLPFPAQVNLRLDPSLAGRVSYPLPLAPNTAWESGSRAALWLGPDEWLLMGPPDAGPWIVEEVATSLAEVHHSVVDVSANRVELELRGPQIHELLSRGCSIDLHPRIWAAGSCVQTMLGKAPVIMHERDEATRILVRTSFADHLMEWLQASGEPSPHE